MDVETRREAERLHARRVARALELESIARDMDRCGMSTSATENREEAAREHLAAFQMRQMLDTMPV